MAHSFVLAFDDEESAFRAYAERFGESAILLIDTYDVPSGAATAARVSAEFLARGVRLRGVRLDSGNLGEDAKLVRRLLDGAGQGHLGIFVSGDLDEHEIARLIAEGAPIDSFGVGTRLGTSSDAPALSGVYKLVVDGGEPRAKYSPGKHTLPGAKQVFRNFERGTMAGDVLKGVTERPSGEPLLRRVAAEGQRLEAPSALDDARDRRAAAVAALPAPLRSLETAAAPYPVRTSDHLAGLARDVEARIRAAIAHSPGIPTIER
jgi:nicotinate phosphoribosyltransferase